MGMKIEGGEGKGGKGEEFGGVMGWWGKEGFDLTLIEVMPMGDIGGENRVDQYLPLSLVRARLAQRWTLEDIDYRSGGAARYARIAETGRRLGVITPPTDNFFESWQPGPPTRPGTFDQCLGPGDAGRLRQTPTPR